MIDSWRAAAFPLRLKCVHPCRRCEPAKTSRYNAQLNSCEMRSKRFSLLRPLAVILQTWHRRQTSQFRNSRSVPHFSIERCVRPLPLGCPPLQFADRRLSTGFGQFDQPPVMGEENDLGLGGKQIGRGEGRRGASVVEVQQNVVHNERRWLVGRSEEHTSELQSLRHL